MPAAVGAGVTIPPKTVHRMLRTSTGLPVGSGASVCLAAAMEYIMIEVMQAGSKWLDQNPEGERDFVMQRDLLLGIVGDTELRKLFTREASIKSSDKDASKISGRAQDEIATEKDFLAKDQRKVPDSILKEYPKGKFAITFAFEIPTNRDEKDNFVPEEKSDEEELNEFELSHSHCMHLHDEDEDYSEDDYSDDEHDDDEDEDDASEHGNVNLDYVD